MVEQTLQEYLNSQGIEFKEAGSNKDQYALKICPYCEYEKKPFGHFYFSTESKCFYCQHCGSRGNLFKFRLDRGEIIQRAAKQIRYVRPNPMDSLTTETDKFYEWYEKTRGIKKDILKRFKVGLYKKNGEKYICYQYFNQKNEIIDRKYRNIKDKKKMFTEKQAEKIYYGSQFIDSNTKILMVCEGEDDCHALIQLGYESVVSVPNGASNYSPAMHKMNERMQSLILLFDNDVAGQEGARKFAEKAGLYKCKNVILPFKDVRECLKMGVSATELMGHIEKAQDFKLDDILNFKDMKVYFAEDTNEIGYQLLENEAFNKIVGGIRQGEMTVLTGHTGHGKSTYSYNMLRWCLNIGLKCMMLSFENRIKAVMYDIIEAISGEIVKGYSEEENKKVWLKSQSWVEDKAEEIGESGLYMLASQQENNGYFDINKMEQVIEYAVKFYDIQVFVIDHLHYFMNFKETTDTDNAIRRVKQWTNRLNIHIILIAHPNKTEDSRKGKLATLGLNCVKGASSIPQESDNFWIIERPADESISEGKLTVKKNRGNGLLGSIYYRVDGKSFYEKEMQ